MSSRRNTAPELNDTELAALIRLRVLRIPDATLLDQLPERSPSAILRRVDRGANPIVDERVQRALVECRRLNVGVVTVADANYPETLNDLGELRPPVLFYRGNFELAHSRVVAIVGTRRCTEYGIATTEMIASELAQYGLTIISGLALGVDGQAHRSTMEAGGKTIAVLGCGVNVLYPHRNAKLQEQIAEEGLLLSEFAPGEPAMKHNFLKRNRIIAVLSRAVVVVEAGPRSGSLNTASWAREHNVDVYTVPGPIGREASIGTNALLFDGAKMVISVRDILEGLPWRVSRIATSLDEPKSAPSGSRLGDRIYDILGPVALHIDQIARGAGCPASSALPVLVELELQGLVRQFPGKRFARASIRTA